MTQQEIFDGLKEMLHTIKPGVDQDAITMDSTLVFDLGIDSLSILLLSIAIENTFGFKFDQVPPFKTVGDVVRYIAAKTT